MEHRSNPVLNTDWPDPDVLRRGSEYWMTNSSFNRAPGLPVLRSENLVDWEHVTNALPALPPTEHYALPRHGSGVWAPTIREHEGTVFIVYPDPDRGIFVLTAPHPAGPWSRPHLLLAGRGLIDPCPLWDTDGRTYLVHAWARSQARVKNRLSLVEVTADLSEALTPSRIIIDGDRIPGMITLEGPKAYLRNGEYWIYAPAGGVAEGYQVAFRSNHPYGPYEHRIVLEQGSSAVNGPHQGALVDDVHGNWWFVHFQDRGVFGRVTHVQPVRFDDDGWPHMGEPIDDVRGRPVDVVPRLGPPEPENSREPAGAESGAEYREPLRSDDFTSETLHPRWHWQANPRPELSRTGHGRLDLAFAPSPRGDLRDLPQVVGQQLPGRPSQWSLDLHLPGAACGTSTGLERAGLVVLGASYAWAGLRRDADGVALVHAVMGKDEAEESGQMARLLSSDPTDDVSIRLHLDVDAAGHVTLGASEPQRPHAAAGWSDTEAGQKHAGDGQNADETPSTYTALLTDWPATKGHWIGAEVGLFATGESLALPSLHDRHASFGPVTVRCDGQDC